MRAAFLTAVYIFGVAGCWHLAMEYATGSSGLHPGVAVVIASVIGGCTIGLGLLWATPRDKRFH